MIGTLRHDYKEIIELEFPDSTKDFDGIDLSSYLNEKQYFIFDSVIPMTNISCYCLLADDNWVIPETCIEFEELLNGGQSDEI